MAVGALMQVREAARYLGVHENTLRRWEEKGLVRAVRLPSGVRRFRVGEVERLRAEMYDRDSSASREFHDSIVGTTRGRSNA